MKYRQFSNEEERQQFNARKEIANYVEIRIRTSFIFPIAQLEELFGHLWGHGKDASILTEREKAWRGRFEEWRELVMDIGNREIRRSKNKILGE